MAHGVRDNTGFYVDDSVQTLAEALKARGFRTGGFVGAFVLDRRWGIAPGLRHLLRRVRPVRGRRTGTGRHPAAGRRGRGPGARLARRQRASSRSSPGSTSTIRTRPTHRRRSFALALPGHAATAPTTPRSPTPTRRSGGCMARLDAAGRLDDTLVVVAGRSRRAARRARRAVARLLRLRRGGADSADHRRARRRAAGRARPGPHRRRDADRARPAGRAAAGRRPGRRRCGRLLDGQRQELLAFSESWYPRFHYGWSELQAVRDGRYKFILAPTRELYDVAGTRAS